MPGSESRLLILGLGNLLCTDDGVGPVAAQAIAETRVVPEGVQVLDGGTLGLSLLPYLEDAERAILVDAIEIDAPPGTLVRLEGDEVGPAVAARLSVHQVGVSDLIEAARWRERIPPTLVLHGAKDYRVPVEQGMALYATLMARGVPARLVVYPEENHWILKPQNSLGWYAEVGGWLARWLG